MTRILVVDDEKGIRNLLVRWIRGWGHDVTAVATTADALDQMTASPFPVVVCDVIMPVHDGIWLLAQIRQRWPQTVVLMASGAQESHTIAKAREYGAVDFVPKPIERELLRQALQRAFAALGDESGKGS